MANSPTQSRCRNFMFMGLVAKWINNTKIIRVHTDLKYIGICIQKWIGSISCAIFKGFEIKIIRSIMFQNIC